MKDEKMLFVDVNLDNLHYPLNVISKPNSSGESTISKITVKAKIENRFEKDFPGRILGIINNRKDYIGPNQLSSRIIEYINSINGSNAFVSFEYPYFMETTSPFSKEKRLVRYECNFILEAISLLRHKKKFIVDIPIPINNDITVFLKDKIDVPANIIVEVEGNEALFTEDIVDVVEENLMDIIYSDLAPELKEYEYMGAGNPSVLLIEKIRKNLLAKYKIDNCTVKIIFRNLQFSYSAQVSKKPEGANIETYYDGEHIFI